MIRPTIESKTTGYNVYSLLFFNTIYEEAPTNETSENKNNNNI